MLSRAKPTYLEVTIKASKTGIFSKRVFLPSRPQRQVFFRKGGDFGIGSNSQKIVPSSRYPEVHCKPKAGGDFLFWAILRVQQWKDTNNGKVGQGNESCIGSLGDKS